MENSKFVSISMSNGNYFGMMTKTNVDYLVQEGLLKKDFENYVVASNADIQYLNKFYNIDTEDEELEF